MFPQKVKRPSYQFTSATRLSQDFIDYLARVTLATIPLSRSPNWVKATPTFQGGFKDPWLSVPPSRMVWLFGSSVYYHKYEWKPSLFLDVYEELSMSQFIAIYFSFAQFPPNVSENQKISIILQFS
jgi:hypothetical protein